MLDRRWYLESNLSTIPSLASPKSNIAQTGIWFQYQKIIPDVNSALDGLAWQGIEEVTEGIHIILSQSSSTKQYGFLNP